MRHNAAEEVATFISEFDLRTTPNEAPVNAMAQNFDNDDLFEEFTNGNLEYDDNVEACEENNEDVNPSPEIILP